MIEVVFSESAAGSLKCAISLHRFDGGDILCLPLYLHIGDIREENFWEERVRVLDRLVSVYPDCSELAQTIVERAAEDLQCFAARINAGENVRIWTSRSPDDASGYVWFCGWINSLPAHGAVRCVHLPWFEEREDGSIVLRSGCQEIDPDTWAQIAAHEMLLPDTLCAMMQYEWERLQIAGMPLRAIINGRLVAVPETFYDFLLIREIALQPEVFNEAVAIGRLLGEYQLGISDAWLGLRFEAMIAAHWLEPVSSPPAEGPSYHRQLKKLVPFSEAMITLPL